GLLRAELPLRVAQALEGAGQARTGQVLAGLAHHYTAALPLGGRERAIEYNRLAAEAAAGALAFGEAVERLRTALSLTAEDDAQRAEMLIALGTELYRAGNTVDSLSAFHEAAGVARDISDGEMLARAAIGFENTCARPGLEDQGAVPLLEAAFTLPSPADS